MSMRMSRLVDAPVAGQVVDEPLGDGDLVLGGAGLALLVDGQRDQRGAVLARERR